MTVACGVAETAVLTVVRARGGRRVSVLAFHHQVADSGLSGKMFCA